MSISLYHVPLFRSTRTLWMYHELRALYPDLPSLKIISLDPVIFRHEKPPDLLAINPNGKVPAFRDSRNDVEMFESCSILTYLLEQFDKNELIHPKSDPKYLSRFLQIAFYVSGTVDNLTAISSPIQAVLEEKKPGLNPEVISKNGKFFKEICGPLLDKWLGRNKFFNGEKFSAIDVIVSYTLISIRRKGLDFLDEFDTLKTYCDRVSQRPALQKALSTNPNPESIS